jgi:hypothetical protein
MEGNRWELRYKVICFYRYLYFIIFIDQGYTLSEIAEEMRITVRSLKYKISQCGVSVRSRYSLISTEDLESIVRQICTENEQLSGFSKK